MDSLRSTFDRVAELYDRARPSYPAALIDDVAALGPRILEIEPGTGQATRALVECGAEVTAVELGPRLAAIARRNVPQADVVTADSETWEPEQAGFDAVVAFTSFHRLDPETKYAKLDLIHARIEARPAKSVTKHYLATLTLGRRL